MYVCMHIYIYIYIYVPICVCIYIYISTYDICMVYMYDQADTGRPYLYWPRISWISNTVSI